MSSGRDAESWPMPRWVTRAYEWGQLKRGAIAAAPVWLFVAVAVWAAGNALTTVSAGLVLFGLSAWAGWRSGTLARGVRLGLAIATLPFGAALISQITGHICTSTGCVSLCAPLCTAAGVVAGVVLYRMLLAQPQQMRWFGWGVTSLVVVSVSALGCSCLGAGSTLGVVIGHLTATGMCFAVARLSPRAL